MSSFCTNCGAKLDDKQKFYIDTVLINKILLEEIGIKQID